MPGDSFDGDPPAGRVYIDVTAPANTVLGDYVLEFYPITDGHSTPESSERITVNVNASQG